MQGVASVLDARHNAKVEDLWAELEHRFGLKRACVAYPHFTYQVAERYHLPGVEAVLREVARATKPMEIITSGLGIFTGERPVLYVRVVRDLLLTKFHDEVWDAISPFAQGIHEHHYGHKNWIPHITLAIEDLTHDNLPDVIRLLSQRPFNWEITINSVSLVLDVRGKRDQWLLFPFHF